MGKLQNTLGSFKARGDCFKVYHHKKKSAVAELSVLTDIRKVSISVSAKCTEMQWLVDGVYQGVAYKQAHWCPIISGRILQASKYVNLKASH